MIECAIDRDHIVPRTVTLTIQGEKISVRVERVLRGWRLQATIPEDWLQYGVDKRLLEAAVCCTNPIRHMIASIILSGIIGGLVVGILSLDAEVAMWAAALIASIAQGIIISYNGRKAHRCLEENPFLRTYPYGSARLIASLIHKLINSARACPDEKCEDTVRINGYEYKVKIGTIPLGGRRIVNAKLVSGSGLNTPYQP